jgi:bZIP transcription factor
MILQTEDVPLRYDSTSNSQVTRTVAPSEDPGNLLSSPAERKTFRVSPSTRVVKVPKKNSHSRAQIETPPTEVEKSARRRQQNRISQIAYRQRSKMTLITLQEELDQSMLVNDALYGTIEALLEKTENLKRSIEDVLTSRFKRSRSESFNSPRSSLHLKFACDGTGN